MSERFAPKIVFLKKDIGNFRAEFAQPFIIYLKVPRKMLQNATIKSRLVC